MRAWTIDPKHQLNLLYRYSNKRVSAVGQMVQADTQAVDWVVLFLVLFFSVFYRMLCAVYAMAVCLTVCLSQVAVLLKQLNVGTLRQRHTVFQGFSLTPKFFFEI